MSVDKIVLDSTSYLVVSFKERGFFFVEQVNCILLVEIALRKKSDIVTKEIGGN